MAKSWDKTKKELKKKVKKLILSLLVEDRFLPKKQN